MEEESDVSLGDISSEVFKELSDEDEPEITLDQLKKSKQTPPTVPTLPDRGAQPPVSSKPVVVEDFIRNYLRTMKMEKTLNCFQVSFTNL